MLYDLCICNTILHFLVFYASFFDVAIVRHYFINGYIKKGKRLTFAAFASLATLAFGLFLKICVNLRFSFFLVAARSP